MPHPMDHPQGQQTLMMLCSSLLHTVALLLLAHCLPSFPFHHIALPSGYIKREKGSEKVLLMGHS